MKSQILCLAAQDRLRCACVIVASAPAAFAESCKDLILLGRLLTCANQLMCITCTMLMRTCLVHSLDNWLELLVISLECHAARMLCTTEESVRLRLMQTYSALTSIKQSGKGDSRHTWPV